MPPKAAPPPVASATAVVPPRGLPPPSVASAVAAPKGPPPPSPGPVASASAPRSGSPSLPTAQSSAVTAGNYQSGGSSSSSMRPPPAASAGYAVATNGAADVTIRVPPVDIRPLAVRQPKPPAKDDTSGWGWLLGACYRPVHSVSAHDELTALGIGKIATVGDEAGAAEMRRLAEVLPAPVGSHIRNLVGTGKRQGFRQLPKGSGTWRYSISPGQSVLLWTGSIAGGAGQVGTWSLAKVRYAGENGLVLLPESDAPAAASGVGVVLGRCSAHVQPALEDRGMTKAQLKCFLQDGREGARTAVKDPRDFLDATRTQRNPNYARPLNFEQAPTWLVVDLFVKPQTQASEGRVPFVDIMGDLWPQLGGPRPATHFVSHSWHGSFAAEMGSLLEHQRGDAFWMAWAALTQDENRRERMIGQSLQETVLGRVMSAASITSQVLLVSPQAQPLQRTWVLMELLWAERFSKPLAVCPPDAHIASWAGSVDWDRSECTVREDRQLLNTHRAKFAAADVPASVEAALSAALRRQTEAAVLDFGSEHLSVASIRRTLGEYLGLLPGHVAEAEREMREALRLFQVHSAGTVALADMLDRIGFFYARQNRFMEAEREFERALTIKINVQGENDLTVAETRDNLGLVLAPQHKAKEAEAQYSKAVNIKQSRLREDDLRIATSRHGLAVALAQLGEWPQAVQEFESALRVRTQSLRSDDKAISETRTALGGVLVQLAEYQRAKPHLDAALKARSAVFGRSHPHVAETLVYLGQMNAMQEKLEEARRDFEEALNIRFAHYGQVSASTAAARLGLAGVLAQLRKFDEALKEYDAALDACRSLHGSRHPTVADCRDGRGSCLALQDRLQEALVDLDAAVDIRQEFLGEHPLTADTLHNMGSVSQRLNLVARAEREFEKAVAIKKKVFGKEHPTVALSRFNYGAVLAQQGLYKEAGLEYEAVLQSHSRRLGPDHVKVAEVRLARAQMLVQMGEFEHALAEYEVTIKAMVSKVGAQHISIGEARNNLGVVLAQLERFPQAQEQYETALRIKRSHLGADHLSVADTTNNMGIILMHQKKFEKAEQLFLEALTTRERHLGATHPSTVETLSNLRALTSSRSCSVFSLLTPW
eukprot:TRINITY_DN7949_c0_g2_i1.p1 TRINITY_DN7949_c0_g2~~TRINITY_DN7949_c0_g2_i1.p1  ORF type:complete len:1110 (+),score=231.08 TRINITY_DN7949_c0_g2_i1:478-3807(+)